MSKRKSDHCIMRNGKMFCSHCGQYQELPMPMRVEMFTAMLKTFCKIHKDCEPTWKEPEVDQSLSEMDKAQFWLNHGERGTSSETMFQRISGHRIIKSECHPKDPDDFRRCYKLLKIVPEWKHKLYVMREVSPQWAALVDNWDKLTEMVEEQLAGKKNDMYDFMQTLIK